MQSLIWHYFPWNIQVSITNFSLFSTHMARFSNYIFHSAWKDVLLYIYMLELYWTPQSQLEEAVFLDPLFFKLTGLHYSFPMELITWTCAGVMCFLTGWSGSSLIEELNSQLPLYSYNIQQSLAFEERECNLKIHCFLLFRGETNSNIKVKSTAFLWPEWWYRFVAWDYKQELPKPQFEVSPVEWMYHSRTLS